MDHRSPGGAGLVARARGRVDLLQAGAGLLWGLGRCLSRIGALPEKLVWDREGAIAPLGRPTDAFAAFCGQLGVGWINLDDAAHFVGTLCPADYNHDGFVDGIDYDLFNNDFEAGKTDADFNRDGFLDGIDYDQFNNHFEAGC